MNQLEKMHELYKQIKEKIVNEGLNSEEATEFVGSEQAETLITNLEISFPFQYSSEEEGMYFFATAQTLKEYILERLCNEGIIAGEDDYESSDWESSSC